MQRAYTVRATPHHQPHPPRCPADDSTASRSHPDGCSSARLQCQAISAVRMPTARCHLRGRTSRRGDANRMPAGKMTQSTFSKNTFHAGMRKLMRTQLARPTNALRRNSRPHSYIHSFSKTHINCLFHIHTHTQSVLW